MRRLVAIFLLSLSAFAGSVCAQSGAELMAAFVRQYAPPAYDYEEQVLVLTDRESHYTVRTLRHFALRGDKGSQSLWVIETPADAKGTAIYVERDAQGDAYGRVDSASRVFGSDFSVADLEEERMGEFRYERAADRDLDQVPYYVVRAIPADEAVTQRTGYHARRLYLRQDNLFVSRIDYLDRDGRQVRCQTFRDPRPDESGVWRPGMILMEGLRDGTRTLLKIERRVHSPDYVPATVFAGFATP